jgi:5-methylcytosine-specific restriction endonuclease McrA
MVCSSCSQVGHTRASKECPKYGAGTTADRNTLWNRISTLNYELAATVDSSIEYKVDRELMSKMCEILGEDKTICVYCKTEKANSPDHFHPRIKDGKYTGYGNHPLNIVPCCKTCNSQKGNKTLLEWKPHLATDPMWVSFLKFHEENVEKDVRGIEIYTQQQVKLKEFIRNLTDECEAIRKMDLSTLNQLTVGSSKNDDHSQLPSTRI